ncbi:MAG: hypothetical protein U1E65_35145 [Myxococcota bacterium]
MSFWSKKPPVAPSSELISMLQEKVIAPLVHQPFDTPSLSGRGSVADGLEAVLGNYRPEYAETLRAQIQEAKRICAEAGVNYEKIVSELGSEALALRKKIAVSSAAEIFALRTSPLPTDVVLYSWQSHEGVEALLKDPEAYCKGVAQSGFFMCENVWNTSGYTGGAPLGEMVEIHIKAGTPFADVTPNSVKQSLDRMHEYHTSARTQDGAQKPLNRYNAVDGWWQLTQAKDATFHRFEPSTRPTAVLLAELDRIAPSGLPFFLGSVNKVLLARGEAAVGPLAAPVEAALLGRLGRTLEELRANSNPYTSGWLGLAAAFVDQSARYPSLAAAVSRDLKDMGDAELTLHARLLMLYAPEDHPPPGGMKALGQAIRAEAAQRGLDEAKKLADEALVEFEKPPVRKRR